MSQSNGQTVTTQQNPSWF